MAEYSIYGNDPAASVASNPNAPSIIDSALIVGTTAAVAYVGNKYFPTDDVAIRNGYNSQLACTLNVATAAAVAETLNWALRGGTNLLPLPDSIRDTVMSNMRLVPPLATGAGVIIGDKLLPYGNKDEAMIMAFGKGALSNVIARAAYNYVMDTKF